MHTTSLDRHLADAMYALNKATDHTDEAVDLERIRHLRDKVADLRCYLDPSLKL